MVGVWIDPVTAHVMMTLPWAAAMESPLYEIAHASVDRERLASDVLAGVAGEEERHAGDLLRAYRRAHAGRLQEFFQESLAAHAQGLRLGIDHPVDALSLDDAGADAVHADPVGAGFHRKAFGEADHA